jgi:hypothetical protein
VKGRIVQEKLRETLLESLMMENKLSATFLTAVFLKELMGREQSVLDNL